QPPLQRGEREPNGESPSPLATFLEALGPVHPSPDVFGDGVIEALLHRGQLVLDGDGTPLREESPTIEGQQALLDIAAHQVGRFGNLVSDPGTGGETIRIEERQEELEVLVLAVVWRG